MIHGKPCVNMHVSGEARNRWYLFVEERRNKKEEKKKRKGKKEKKERERERRRKKEEREREKRKPTFRWSELVGPRSKVRIFDEDNTPKGRDSSYLYIIV